MEKRQRPATSRLDPIPKNNPAEYSGPRKSAAKNKTRAPPRLAIRNHIGVVDPPVSPVAVTPASIDVAGSRVRDRSDREIERTIANTEIRRPIRRLVASR
jgi:hypothetical protein